MITASLILAALIAGFGMGRIKNASKLAAVKNEIAKLEAGLTSEASLAISKIKSLL